MARRETPAGGLSPEVLPDIAEYLPLHQEWRRRVFVARMDLHSTEVKCLRRQMQTVRSRVMRFFMSEARVAFGFKRVGEGWVSETMLFRIVRTLWPDMRPIRHHRPDCLDGLELDIYAPALNVDIEYQGAQHSEPIEHWGGAAALSLKLRNRCRAQSPLLPCRAGEGAYR